MKMKTIILSIIVIALLASFVIAVSNSDLGGRAVLGSDAGGVTSNTTTIIINEVELNPEGDDQGFEWVELYSEEEFDLEGYYLENNDGDIYKLSGVFSDYFVVQFESQWLDNSDEKVYLKNDNEIIDETPVFTDEENNVLSWGWCDSVNDWRFTPSTQGQGNECPGGGGGGGGGGGPNLIEIDSCQVLDIEGGNYELQNDILTSGDCFTIEADNITLDLNGHIIAGDDAETAILIEGFSYSTIKNGEIYDFDEGIYIRGGSNHIIRDILIGNTYYGIYFKFTSNNEIVDTIILDSNKYDFYIRAQADLQCEHILTNVIGTGNKPILFYNSAVNEGFIEASELILCNADNSMISNIAIDNQNNFNNGILVLLTERATLYGITVNNSYRGIWFINSNDNILYWLDIINNQKEGIRVWSSNGLHIIKSTIANNGREGIDLNEATNNIFMENHIENNAHGGIAFEDESFGNLIYNNLFNNVYNIVDISGEDTNVWNVSQQEGPNIIGGPYIGGNYWAKPDGTGYSQTCEDSNSDGFCDEAYFLEENNIDYLPLTTLITKSADLAVLDIIFNPENPEEGGSLQIDAIITNLGDVATAFWIELAIINPNGIPSGQTIPADPTDLLEPNETIKINFWGFGPLIQGTYTATVTVHAEEPDSNESNNQLTETVYVSGDNSSVGIDDDPMLGDPNASVTLIEFGDFQDPFTERFWRLSLPLIKQNFIDTKKINYVFRDFPLDIIHPYAQKAAEASECADEQRMYWSYHDYLLGNQSDWTSSSNINEAIEKFKEYAQILGLNSKEFDFCLDSGQMESEVQNDFNDGQDAGVAGTPTFFVQNICGDETTILGAQPYSVFEEALNQSLKSCTEYTDVAVTNITISPEAPKVGDIINITITIQNLGDVVTNVALGYSIFYEGGGQIWQPCDFCIELEPGETYLESVNFFIEDPGEYTINADVLSEIPDNNPNNNELSLTFIVEENLCPADFNGDGSVGASDLLTLLAAWGTNEGHPADLDGNGVVDGDDLNLLLDSWGEC